MNVSGMILFIHFKNITWPGSVQDREKTQVFNQKPLKPLFFSEKPLKTFIWDEKPLFSRKAVFQVKLIVKV